MSDTSISHVANLKKTLSDQNQRISSLVLRVSTLNDEVENLKSDLVLLREHVGEDLKKLFVHTNI